jgi:hypothetical protein
MSVTGPDQEGARTADSSDTERRQPARSRLAWVLAAVSVALVGAIVTAALVTIAWRDTFSQLQSAESSLSSADERATDYETANDSLEAQLRVTRDKYRAAQRTFRVRVKQATRAAIADVREAAFEEVFGGYDEPWQAGHWYIVEVGRDVGHLALVTRSEISPDSGTAYWVEGEDIYYDDTYGLSSSSAPGGYNGAGCPKNQWVSGYFRSDGSYVSGYWRNSPADSCDSSP